MTYYEKGLLASFTDANNNSSTFEYDTLGRLTKDTDANGGFTALKRISIPYGYEVRDSTAEGTVKIFRVQNLPDGTKRKEVQGCCGGSTVTNDKRDGTIETIFADSTVVKTSLGPDPRFGMLVPVVKSQIVRTP